MRLATMPLKNKMKRKSSEAGSPEARISANPARTPALRNLFAAALLLGVVTGCGLHPEEPRVACTQIVKTACGFDMLARRSGGFRMGVSEGGFIRKPGNQV